MSNRLGVLLRVAAAKIANELEIQSLFLVENDSVLSELTEIREVARDEGIDAEVITVTLSSAERTRQDYYFPTQSDTFNVSTGHHSDLIYSGM